MFSKFFFKPKPFKKSKQFRFDLHGFTLTEANEKVRELIIDCQEDQFSEILLITGKGLHSNTDQNTYVSKELSKLKFSVPEYGVCMMCKDRIEKASIKTKGEGAIIIKLKKL